MGPEISLADVFKELGLNPSDWCMRIDGIHRADNTTADEALNDGKLYRGHGCYKTQHHYPRIAKSDSGNGHRNSK